MSSLFKIVTELFKEIIKENVIYGSVFLPVLSGQHESHSEIISGSTGVIGLCYSLLALEEYI